MSETSGTPKPERPVTDPPEVFEIALIVRRRRSIPNDLVTGTGTISAEDLRREYGADPADLARVREVMAGVGLEVVGADPAARRVVVRGTTAALTGAFGPRLSADRPGEPRVPAGLEGVVTAVLGWDLRAHAVPMFRSVPGRPRIVYTPPELGELYGFPDGTDGSGQTLAIVSATGGYRQEDMDGYFAQLGLPTPTILSVGVAGATNAPGPEDEPPSPADIEALLDVQVAGALAPGARLVNYFAPNTDAGLVEAVRTAIHATPTPTAVNLSWGTSEGAVTAHFRAAMEELFVEAAALGITVCAASGDAGSGNGEHDGGSHVNYPASSPHVLAVGGTTLVADPSTRTIASETVWNTGSAGATGGGVSAIFPLPRWQAGVDVPNRYGRSAQGRGVPDVAANADGMTGYQIFMRGQTGFVGGTSAASPLWAALVCRLAQALGRPLGLLSPLVYPRPDEDTGSNTGTGTGGDTVTPGFRDVVAGDNGAYAAAPGWDPNSGLGSPDGTALLAVLRARLT